MAKFYAQGGDDVILLTRSQNKLEKVDTVLPQTRMLKDLGGTLSPEKAAGIIWYPSRK